MSCVSLVGDYYYNLILKDCGRFPPCNPQLSFFLPHGEKQTAPSHVRNQLKTCGFSAGEEHNKKKGDKEDQIKYIRDYTEAFVQFVAIRHVDQHFGQMKTQRPPM